MKIALFAVAAWWMFGALVAIANIGKTRKGLTPRAAAILVTIDAAIITVIIMAALRS